MKLKLYITILSVVTLFTLHAQNANFKRTYGGNAYASGNSLVKTPDGGYLCVGSSSATATATTDVYIFKTDSNGVHLWTKFYGGNNIDVANHIVATPDNNYIICGYTNTIGNGGYDVYLLKINGSGDTLWTRTYGGLDWDFGNEAYVSPTGSIYVSGQTFSYTNSGSGMLLKLDGNGNQQFIKTYGGPGEESFSSLCPAFNNAIALAGFTDSYGGGKRDAYIIVADTNGVKLDSLINGGGEDDELNDINPAAGNGLLAGGYTKSIGPNQRQDIFVLRADSITDYLWNANFDGASLNAIFPANNPSEYAVAGYSTNAQSGTPLTAFLWIGTSQPGAWLPNYCPFFNFNGRKEYINDVIKVPGGWCSIGTSELHAPGISSAILMRLNNNLSDCTNPGVVLNTEEDKAGLKGIKLFPNPSTGTTTFSLENKAKNLSLIVYNAVGQEVFNKTYNGAQQVEEDFSNLGNGLYQARITADGKYSAQTFIIAK